MFHDYIRRQKTRQIFFLLFLLAIGVGMTRSVSADSGPLFNDGVVTGRIVDSDGNGIAGISVYLQNTKQYQPFGAYGSDTDADGNFEISGITRGSYRARIQDYGGRYAVQYAGGGIQSSSATVYEIWGPQPVDVSAQVADAGTITGKLSTSGNAESFNPTVSAWYFDDGLGFWIEASIDYYAKNGSYVLDGLPAGEFIVGASNYFSAAGRREVYYQGADSKETATPVIVPSGGTIPHIDLAFDVSKELGGVISGRVVSAETGSPLSDISVQLYILNKEAGDWLYPIGYITTDQNGEYSFANLDTDNYKVGFDDFRDKYATEYNGNKPTLGGAPEIALERGQHATVNAELALGSYVIIPVKNVNYREFEGGSIVAYRWNDHDAWLEVDAEYSRSSNMQIRGLATGRYVFEIHGDFKNSSNFTKWYKDGNSPETALEVTISEFGVHWLDPVVIGEETGTLRGRITSSDGKPVSNAVVRIESTAPHQYDNRFVRTNTWGEYVYNLLEVGEYRVFAIHENRNWLTSYYGGSEGATYEEASAATVVIGADESVSADIQMLDGGSIQGRVTIPQNFKADYAYALAYIKVGGEWRNSRYAEIKDGGYYNLDLLIPGEYKIYFSASKYQTYPNPPFTFGEWYNDVANRSSSETLIVAAGDRIDGINASLGNHIASESRTDGEIAGQVLSIVGASLEQLEVRAYKKMFPRRGRSYWSLAMTVTPDADGNYVFEGLAHGEYVLGFYDPANQYKPEYFDNVSDIESALVLVISAETPTISGIDAILQLSQNHVK